MKSIAPLLFFLACFVFVQPAHSQGYGYGQNFQGMPVPGMVNSDAMNCGAQPSYMNPIQQMQPMQQYPMQQMQAMQPYPMQQQYQPMPGQMTQFEQMVPQYNQMDMQTQVPSGETSQGQPSYSDPMAGHGDQQNLSPYQQQEMALQQAQMAQQLEDMKHNQESKETFRMSSEFNDKGNDSSSAPKKNKAQGVASSMGRLVKGSMKYVGPAAGTVGSFFLLRAAMGGGNNVMMMPGGGMFIAP